MNENDKFDDIKPPFKGVVFDLDGTLIDTVGDIIVSLNYALEKEGYKPVTPERGPAIVGWGLIRTVELALPTGTDNSVVQKIGSIQADYYKDNPADFTYAYKGIVSLLDELEKREIPFGVWTNKDEDIARIVLDKVMAGRKFSIICGTVSHRERKPHPEASKVFTEKWGMNPSEILYVGDTEVDMETADNSNMFPLAVSWGYRSKEELKTTTAKAMVDTPDEILQYL